MNSYQPHISRLLLKETAFQDLMQKRIFNVLLIASPYDIFTLEEDGRVEEQVYFEYVGLNLSSPPRFIKVSNFEEAKRQMEVMLPDLIITMPGVEITDTIEQAKEMRREYPNIPFVMLCPFSREVSRRLANADTDAVDYVFSWLGDVDLILAIIKLIEDKMNADNDVLNIGVQSILVVEDSTRFYSSMLPLLFKYLLTQSMSFSTEALNDHEKMLRMRGRPKVLLARDYNEARLLFDKYGDNMLGVLTDVRYPRNGEMTADAGFRFVKRVREHDPYMPVIIASSEVENKPRAAEVGAVFLDKNSKTLPQDLRDAVRRNFGFGDFVVRDPHTNAEVMRIHNLNEFQKNVFNIPTDALYELAANNSISRWLYSRALFPIGEVLRQFKVTDISQIATVRQLIFDTIVRYRRKKNRGVVAIFRKDRFDKYSNFARIGQGSLGGKGRGLAFIDSIIKKYPECEDFHGVQITIPRTVVLCTDIFDEFMESNGLYPLALSDRPDAEILDAFLKARLPRSVDDDLLALFQVVDRPLAVRSSSVLEDSHYQPFAGVYSTYMVPHFDDSHTMLRHIGDAIKGVYASVFFRDSKAYMNATRNLIDQEKMAVILQEVVGKEYADMYYPSFAGVGRSLNYYPVGDEQAEEGVVEVAAGLGKYIVDGGKALRFSPAHPDKVLQTSTLESALRDTQTELCALPSSTHAAEVMAADDGYNLAKVSVADAFAAGALKFMVSTFDANDRIIRDSEFGPGRKVMTFANILKQGVFPLAKVSEFMLTTGQYEMGRPVEIEFAGMVNPNAMGSEHKGTIYWLQIRPIVDRKEMLDNSWLDRPDEDMILRSETALGHGITDGVRNILYVKPDTFDSMRNPSLAQEIDRINSEMVARDEQYILIGPGRWGSSDPSLGIPVRWAQIAGARLIVEAALPGYRIEPSQGTHFFQNLTSFGVGYFTIDENRGEGFINSKYLASLPAVYESEGLRMVRFEEPLTIAINGRKSKGVVLKPLSTEEC
jgi:CheY-like chemotaxis protein